MPRYFFIIDDDHRAHDMVGLKLDGPEQALNEAVRAAGEALRDLDGRFWTGPEWTVRVTDEQGQTICEIGIRGRRHSA